MWWIVGMLFIIIMPGLFQRKNDFLSCYVCWMSIDLYMWRRHIVIWGLGVHESISSESILMGNLSKLMFKVSLMWFEKTASTYDSSCYTCCWPNKGVLEVQVNKKGQ